MSIKNKRIKRFALLSTLLFSPMLFATPIPTGFDIDGNLTNTQADAFGSQSTTITSIFGGATFSTSLGFGDSSNTPFSETGDGIGFDGSVSGNDMDGITYGSFGNLYALDLLVNMNNTSANDYRIVWDFSYNFLADADGNDAFASTAMTFNDTVNLLFNEYFASDLVFGDLVGNASPGTFGATLGTSGSTSFSFDILAGNTASIDGGLAIGGGAYDVASSFLAELDFDLSINRIEQLNVVTPPPPNPNPIPEPLGISLFAMGLALLFRRK